MAKNKKIILLGKLPPPYIGPAVATNILLKSKLSEIYRLIHLDTSDHRDINTLGAFDLKNIVLPFWQYCKLVYFLMKHRPRAVYIPSAQTTVAFLRDIPYILISKIFGKKVICHLRGGNFLNWYQGAGRIMRWMVRRIQKMVDAQIVLGDCLIEMFTPFMPREKIFVVPNGGDFSVIDRRAENKGKNVVLFLANFVRSKGVLDVLHAALIVFREHPNVEFIFAGCWVDKETQLEFTRFLDDHPELPVTVLGPISGAEKFALFATADIFVFPTYYVNEGHPWVILEAMAAGLPIISTNHGAICEIVVDGVNGYLVEKKNPGQASEKLNKLISDPALLIKMGAASRHIYEQKFTENKMVENISRCFDSVLLRTGKRDVEYIPEKWEKNYIDKKSFQLRMNNVLHLIRKISKIEKILDIGCGTGDICSTLAKKYVKPLIGLDVAQEMVEWCRKKYDIPGLSFSAGTILSLPFPDNSFTTVLSISVIEWIEDYEKAIREVARVLAPGGTWIVSIPNWQSPFRKMQLVFGLLKKSYYTNYQKNRLSISEFRELAKNSNFTFEEEIYHLLPFYPKNIKNKFLRHLGLMCMFSLKKEVLGN